MDRLPHVGGRLQADVGSGYRPHRHASARLVGAYGKYMHWPDLDAIQLGDPFRGPPVDLEGSPNYQQELDDLEQQRADAKPGWAYGAFLLKRFTQWDGSTGKLDLYYLLSFGSPYQIQLMHTTLTLRP
jgi:hypothetical protein